MTDALPEAVAALRPASVPDSPARPSRRRGSPPSLRALTHRFGASPLFVAADAAALLTATLLVGGLTGRAVVFIGLTLALNAGGSLYRSRLTVSILDDLPALVGRALGAGAVVACIDVLLTDHGLRGALAPALLYLALVVPARTLAYGVTRAGRRSGLASRATLILGTGQIGGQVATLMREHPEYGLRPVGFLDPTPLLDDSHGDLPVLGAYSALPTMIHEFDIRNVVVAFGSRPTSELVDIIRTCDRMDCEIFLVPRLFEMHAGRPRETDTLWGLPLVRLRRATHRSLTWGLKRVIDVVLCGLALLLLSPLFVAIALAVRWESGPGVLFRQQRVGLDGRPFDVLKFRSLTPVSETESQTRWTIADDRRIKPVGRLLRKTSLDELPQLWNILRGDMSIVGPRPERPHFVDQFTESLPRYPARHRVPAGLTGWAQIHGLRGDTSIEDRARFDNYYIENWSVWLDLKIMIRTVTLVLFGRGG